ncbi:optic atrophy 3 protein (OPA3) domain-containing protein [Ditylenchus destructor]|uniref:Optic atrophy 3 protein (OPA3) domain-containing protein n=1 Tax=Ditylenchus destructor TaxID=166010 RepID=A0AAD4RAN7_9BILA|nr:optic atrophy 3 protein (OPA3) domain-containing protein [Ditylenchus destructor]
MGLPMIQVVMIIARQMSKPVSDQLMRYGRDHPPFRNKVLIPIGRGIVHLSTRIRMKNLGLGSNKEIAEISEHKALEQASEFLQQVVILCYTVGVFYIYYTYTKSNEKEPTTVEDLQRVKEEMGTEIQSLNRRIDILQDEIRNLRTTTSSGWRFFGLFPFHSSKAKGEILRRHSDPALEPASLQPSSSRVETTQTSARENAATSF